MKTREAKKLAGNRRKLSIPDWETAKIFYDTFTEVTSNSIENLEGLSTNGKAKLRLIIKYFDFTFDLIEELGFGDDREVLVVISNIEEAFSRNDVKEGFELIKEMYAELMAAKAHFTKCLVTNKVVGFDDKSKLVAAVFQDMDGKIINIEVSRDAR